MMDAASGLELTGSGRGAGIAFDFPAGDPSTPSGSPPAKVPRRLRRRLVEGRSGPSTVEEIEAKLKEADRRRQQFHEWLSSKARPKPRSPSWSSQEEDLGQRLEAKLHAAEQKRLSLLAKAQRRLARLDELRQAAKTGVELRFEKEREELGTKVESRVQQAEANRMLLLKAHMQRRAAAQERTAQSLLQRINRENKYKECVRTAIYQKRAAAEKKRLGLLEAEKTRARARVMQARRVAKSVCHQREIQRRKMKEQLEDRLQRAKRQRAEYLRQRGSLHSSGRISWNKMRKHGDFLSRKLARCWRRFVRSRRTTFALANAYEALKINEKFVRSMPFEQLAVQIESATTLQTVKALLERLESRFIFSLSSSLSGPENIDHLLKRLASPNRRVSSSKGTRTRGQTKKVSTREFKSHETKMSRYSVRVVLCAYMILGHPDAVFSGQGERETALADSAVNFIREFELLVKIILDGPNSACMSRQSSPEAMSDDCDDHREPSAQLPSRHNFRSQLAAFDAAWRSYLYRFVVWKVKDARSLEDDLVRVACQLELSMMQTCRITPEGQKPELSHDMRAIQKQVTEDQQLLREKVEHLSGNAGIERMESALSDTRSKFFEAKESGSPSMAPIAHISSPLTSNSSAGHLGSVVEERASVVGGGRSSSVVRSLFQDDASSPVEVGPNILSKDAQSVSPLDKRVVMENELLVNEIIHQNRRAFVDSFGVNDEDAIDVKAKIKETMEKIFWDEIMESLKKDRPDYGRIIGLVKEVRVELCGMASQTWKQEIVDRIDLDILSQVLESGIHDMDYLGNILEYALAMLQKLSAPANEDEMRNTHMKLLSELADIAQSNDRLNSSFVIALVKGLRFVLEQIQVLKKEISKARIRMMEPIIKGPAGLEYLRKAFADRYGPPAVAANSLPLTARWILSVQDILGEWDEHTDSLSTLSISQGLPPVTALRSGGSVPLTSTQSLPLSRPSTSSSRGSEQPECKGERVDVLVRLGLLKLVSGIEGLTQEMLPETLKLNSSRLRTIQGHIQKIIVISISMLVLRQILLSENSASRPIDVENIISDSTKRLCELLDRITDVGITEIVETITKSSSEEKLHSRKEVMAGVIAKSLQAGDAVFARVCQSVYLATRAIVLGGSGACGQRMADAALRRIGASVLLDQVVEIAEVLIVVAIVSGDVHRPWYGCLIHS